MQRLWHRLQYELIAWWRRVWRIKTRAARVIIRRDNSVLLVRFRYHDYLTLPGGYLNRRETFADGARRELLEEVGIVVHSLDRHLGTYLDTRRGKHKTIHIYATENWDYDQDASIDHESADAFWVALSNLPDNLEPATARRLAEYVARPAEPIVGEW